MPPDRRRLKEAFVENLQGHNDPRTALVSKLNSLHSGLRLVEDLKRQKAARARPDRPLAPLPKKWGNLAILLWAVGLTIASFTVGAPVTEAVAFKSILDPLISIEWAEANVGTALTIMIGTPIALSVGLAILITMLRNKLLLPWQYSRVLRSNQDREAHNEANSREFWKNYGNLAKAESDLAAQAGTWYPQAYLHEDAVAFCALAVQNHRANDITAAINLYEAELHQAELLAEQQRTQASVAFASFENSANARATNEAIRQEGARTRAANAAHIAWAKEELRKPQTVHVKRR
jgi:hypothetical protein